MEMKSNELIPSEQEYEFDYSSGMKKELGKDFISVEEMAGFFRCHFSNEQAHKMKESYFSDLQVESNKNTYVFPSSNCDLSIVDISRVFPKSMTIDIYHTHNLFSTLDKIAGGEWFRFKKFDQLPRGNLKDSLKILLGEGGKKNSSVVKKGGERKIPNVAEFSYAVFILSKLRGIKIPSGIYLTASKLCDGGAVIAYIHKDGHLYFGDQQEFESSHETFAIPEITKFPKVK